MIVSSRKSPETLLLGGASEMLELPVELARLMSRLSPLFGPPPIVVVFEVPIVASRAIPDTLVPLVEFPRLMPALTVFVELFEAETPPAIAELPLSAFE